MGTNRPKSKLARNLRFLRKKLKMTQEDLSSKVKIKRSTYAAYEVGLSEPPLDVYSKICKELDITMEDGISKEMYEKEASPAEVS